MIPAESASHAEAHWKRALILIWLCQFLFQSSFSFGIPFVPFFMQSIGVPADELPVWVGLFGSGPALTILLFSPFWGAMADRFGRKKMLLRCYIGGAVVLSGISLCSSPGWMLFFRLLQGIVCGSIPAALSLAASSAPPNRTGFALGVVNSATFSGLLIGSFFGGLAADAFGYRNAFMLSGLPSVLAAFLMFFFVREKFTVPAALKQGGGVIASALKGMIPRHGRLLFIAPILLIMGCVMFVRQFDSSFMPLFVQEIHGGLLGAATWTGIVQSLAGVAGIVAGFMAGYLSDRFEPKLMAVTMAGFAALLVASLCFTPCMGYLVVMRTLANIAVDSVEPSLQVWLCRRIRSSERNVAFSWAASVRAIGWFLSPIAAGFVVKHFGLRAMFGAGAAFFLLVAAMIAIAGAVERKSRRIRV